MSTQVGRPSSVFIGVDLGGTATRFIATDAGARVLNSQIVSTPAKVTNAEREKFLSDAIVGVSGGMAITAIGIGASGPISPDGIIENPDTLPAFTGIDVPAILTRTFRAPTFINNDAVTAAIGEATSGAGQGFDNILMITLGTGIGVCMLQRGEPVRGADGQHPETGHMSITGPPAPCYCGRDTCWEKSASRSALEKSSSLRVTNPTHSSLDIKRMADRASAGDQHAITMFNEFGNKLAEGTATLLTVYRPEILIIGGGGSAYFAHYEGSLQANLKRFTGTFPSPRIAVAHHGEFGGAIGAASMAIARSSSGSPAA